MKRLATLLVIASTVLIASVDAQACNDRQKRETNGSCTNCPSNTRAQAWQGQPNAYCQGDVCPDSSNSVKSYINAADGRCQLCNSGTVPEAPNTSNGLRIRCITGSGQNLCNACLQYRDSNNNCQTCTGTTVVNFNKNGCTFRANCLANQYYDACNQCQSCQAGTTYNTSTRRCESNTTCQAGQTFNSQTGRCESNTTCQAGQSYNSQTGRCENNVVRQNCACDSEFSTVSNSCVKCPSGQTSNHSNKLCSFTPQNCHNNGQIQLGQNQCYQCQSCSAGQTYNSATRSCVNQVVARPQCNCYQVFNSQTNSCVSCGAGQLSGNQVNGQQNGQCYNHQQTCNNNNQVQLTQSQCFGCSSCTAGQSFDRQNNRCITTVVATRCNCYQENANGQCVNCPFGQLSGNQPNGNQAGRCFQYSQTCNNNNQIQLGQNQCFACQSCTNGQVFNRATNSCINQVVVRPTCACYQEFNQGTNQCVNCQNGQLSGNTPQSQNNRCQVVNQQCNARGQVQLQQTQCYACTACTNGQVLSGNQCITRVVRPTCTCYQEYNQSTNQCVNCRNGQLSGNTTQNQNNRCQVVNQQCNARGQVQLDQNSCYACSACTGGQVLSGNQCITRVVRPTCACYQEYNQSTNQCVNCRTGQLSGNTPQSQNNRCQVVNQQCNARGQIQLDQTQCYACTACTGGQTLVGNVCQTPRPSCNCYQEYNQSTNRCVNCNNGQLSGNAVNGQQNNRCQVVNQQCNARGQIQLDQTRCYQCQSCNAGQQLVGNVCQTPRPVCTCYQQYNAQTNRCDQCQNGQLSGNGANGRQDGRCQPVPQQCNRNGQIQLSQNQCYACQPCTGGQQLVGNVCQTPRPQCNCYQEYNQSTNLCVQCRAGQLSGNGVNGQQNGRCQVVNQQCNARGQIQLDQTQCYACTACTGGQRLVGNTCQTPRPVCNCYQEYNQATNTCVNCNNGQLSGNNANGRQDQRCTIVNQQCNARGQIQLGQQQCYGCQQCTGNQVLVGNACQVPRPVCNCYQQYNAQTNRCDQCRAGQLSGNGANGQQNGVCQNVPQQCNQNGQIQLAQNQCYACQACTGLNEVIVNNRCVVRPTCQCFQEYNSATNTCRTCQTGQLADANTGRCQPIPLQCNRNGQRQLAQNQCYQCQACPVGQQLGTNNICITPRPTCQCYEFVNAQNSCQSCPANQLADSTNSRCVPRANTCTGNQVQGNQFSCYQCQACGLNQIPNTTRTQCVQRPFVNCPCTSRRDNTGYQCLPCPTGQIGDITSNRVGGNNLVGTANQCVLLPACDQFSYRLAVDATSCGRCQRCNWPSQIPDPVTGARCVVRPKPTCTCTQRYGDGGYSCIECPFGQVRSGSNNELCVNPAPCNASNQIQLAVDNKSCGRCQTCQFPRFIPDVTKTQCINRPFAVCNDCRTQQSADGYSCNTCPVGQVQDPNNIKRCYRPTCTGQYDIQYALDNVNCGRCETCQWPRYMPNPSKNQCMERPFAKCPSCTTRQSDDLYSCVACPAGQIQDPQRSNVCYQPTCNGIYDIQLRIDNRSCGKCQACAWPRQIPNNERTACVNRPFAQCPDCLTRRSDDNYSCEQCQYGQIQDPTNMNKCITRTCNGQRQIQLGIDSQNCGKCETCQWPQFMPDVTKTQCIARQLANCDCRQKQSPDGYSCQPCGAGLVQSPTNQKQCVRPNCSGQYDIQLSIDTNNCGRCETCQWPQFAPNSSRTQCVPRPFAKCNCLSKRAGLGYTCERCPQGMIQDPNDVNNCVTPYCGGTYQIRRPIDATACGACQDCQWPRYIPNNERTQCVIRPFAKCDCLSKHSQDRYSCEQCPYGQRQDPRNSQRCVDAPRCNQGNQIVGIRDTQSCYQCRTCTLPQIPRDDRSECYRPRPTCKCTERYSTDGYACLPCPNGQVSDDARQACYPAPQCFGPREILGNRQNCYRCNTCPNNLVPNDQRTQCVRPIPVCSCTERYSADGYECLQCPNRQVVDPNQNKRCVPQVCSSRNQIFSTREYCYRCDTCPQGYEPNPQRTECLRIKPKCSCTEIYDSSGYVCVPCPPYQVATNGNQRCVPRQCSGLNQILGTADTCYACKECQKGSTPDNLRRRCLRYIVTQCTCNQRFDDSGFGCIDCPPGTRPSLDNRSCVSLNCDRDQILRRDLLCPQCEWCPPGSIPDPKRENCIVKPRPAINVNGNPTCDEFSVFNMDRTECIKCPNNLKASADNLRCLNSCTDPLDIVQEDGSCFTCCNGNVPNYSRTRCVKKKTVTEQCTGDREIYNSDRTRCTTCDPYTRAQRQNTVCLSDQCGGNQIVTWLGTCANCLAGEKKVDQYTCSGGSGTRLNAQLVEEPVEELSSTVAKKEKSFPTVIVAGLGILIMVLSAVTGMICLRGREKTNTAAVQEEQVAEVSPAQGEAQSIEHLTQVMEKAPTDDSGSNGKNSE